MTGTENKTVCFDFDGTIHPYTKGWVGPVPDDEPPIPGCDTAMRALKLKGLNIVVLSARASDPEGVETIWNYLTKYRLAPFVREVTNKKPPAIAYVDDKAVAFQGDWLAAVMSVETLVAKEKQKGQTW